MNIEAENIFKKLVSRLAAQDHNFSLLLEIINKTSEDIFFISGGTVRDTLLGNNKTVKDIDIFLTAGGYDQIADFLLSNGTIINNQFGTKRWFPANKAAGYYDIIPIPNFYNGLWPCRNMTDVLNQFDITANAVAFDLFNGKVYNPQNGYDDIKNRTLRAVRFDFPELLVSSDINISRNSVLWFRYQYYAKKLNFTIEPITAKWINDNDFRLKDLEKFKEYFFDPRIT